MVLNTCKFTINDTFCILIILHFCKSNSHANIFLYRNSNFFPPKTSRFTEYIWDLHLITYSSNQISLFNFVVLFLFIQQMVTDLISLFSNLVRAAFLPESLENIAQETRDSFGKWPCPCSDIPGGWLPSSVRYIRSAINLSPRTHFSNECSTTGD